MAPALDSAKKQHKNYSQNNQNTSTPQPQYFSSKKVKSLESPLILVGPVVLIQLLMLKYAEIRQTNYYYSSAVNYFIHEHQHEPKSF